MRAVLVTGVSRRRGIAAAVVERLRSDGLNVITAGWSRYDAEHHPGIDEQTETDFQYELGDPSAPRHLVEAAEQRAGPLSALVIAHTYDPGGGLFEMTPELIDRQWRSTCAGRCCSCGRSLSGSASRGGLAGS
jgi:3-oxoacyl-[acyl-carrier protein] reductase